MAAPKVKAAAGCQQGDSLKRGIRLRSSLLTLSLRSCDTTFQPMLMEFWAFSTHIGPQQEHPYPLKQTVSARCILAPTLSTLSDYSAAQERPWSFAEC